MVAGSESTRAKKLIVISAPSGSGKTTIAREILRRHSDISFSVSATTRPMRQNETDGVDYFFLTREEFKNIIDRGELVEWEEIYGQYYGTLKREVDRALQAGKTMLFDVDVKGALSIRRHYRDDAILIFIKPPGIDVLTDRLQQRKTESAEALKRRLDRVPMELAQEKEFDVCVVNDDLASAVNRVDEIVREATRIPV